MNRNHWDIVDRIVDRAAKIAGDELAEFIVQECGGDALLEADVRAQLGTGNVTECLDLHDRVDPTLSMSAATDELPEADLERLRWSSSDRYEIENRLGVGGQGAVYEAWDRQLRRHLALKVLLDTSVDGSSTQISRFLEEAQVTGQLDHPAVVPVHEMGLSEDGRIYFAMRLVRGETLEAVLTKEHAEEEGWTKVRVLQVLQRACEAVAYAHAKGVIHRDLKPENLMVGKYGEVYVMDWGLARVLGQPDARDLRIDETASHRTESIQTDRRDLRDSDLASPLVTMDGLVVGTPCYMSPEQAEGRVEEMGPPSDVYSMGAILYQMLTGERPYIPKGARISARTVLARVLEGPPKPVVELAPEAAPGLVKICERAMARMPGDRYPNMNALAIALRKFAEARDQAARSAAELEAVAKFQESLLAGFDPQTIGGFFRDRVLAQLEAGGPESAAQIDFTGIAVASLEYAVFQRALTSMDQQMADRPVVHARLLQALAKLTRMMGLLDFAVEPQQRAVALRLEALGEGHPQTIESHVEHGYLLYERGMWPEAEALLRDTLATAERLLGPDEPQALMAAGALGFVLLKQVRRSEAEVYLVRVRDKVREALGDSHEETIKALLKFGVLRMAQERLSEAEPAFVEALEQSEKSLGVDHPLSLWGICNIAHLRQRQGRLAEGVRVARIAVERHRRLLGSEHRYTLNIVHQLGIMLTTQGEYEEAEACHREVWETANRTLGEDHGDCMSFLMSLGWVLHRKGDSAEGEALIRRSAAVCRAKLGVAHVLTMSQRLRLSRVLVESGKLDEARPLAAELVDLLPQALDANDTLLASCHSHYSSILLACGEYEAAISEQERADGVLQTSDLHLDWLRVRMAKKLLRGLEAAAKENADGPQSDVDIGAEVERWRQRIDRLRKRGKK